MQRVRGANLCTECDGRCADNVENYLHAQQSRKSRAKGLLARLSCFQFSFSNVSSDNDDPPRPDQFSASANRRCPPPARCAPKQCQLSAKPINVPGAFQLLKILQLRLCRQTRFSNPLLPPTSWRDKTPRCPSPARRSARRC